MKIKIIGILIIVLMIFPSFLCLGETQQINTNTIKVVEVEQIDNDIIKDLNIPKYFQTGSLHEPTEIGSISIHCEVVNEMKNYYQVEIRIKNIDEKNLKWLNVNISHHGFQCIKEPYDSYIESYYKFDCSPRINKVTYQELSRDCIINFNYSNTYPSSGYALMSDDTLCIFYSIVPVLFTETEEYSIAEHIDISYEDDSKNIEKYVNIHEQKWDDTDLRVKVKEACHQGDYLIVTNPYNL
ncbi:MAG: hypothetical protein MUO82_03115, partial [Candidatus Thermoplasmatota archaeon]|nr:hypothetical protein [Candidatus Thermoplasmatota archaeon]